MTTESLEQIAQEATEELTQLLCLSLSQEARTEQIILAAIGKAVAAKDSEIAAHVKGMLQRQAAQWTPISLAQHFHNLYERAAPEFGYETRTETRAFNPESSNGKLMIAVCSEILRDFNAALAAERGNRDGFRRALEQRIGEVDELRQQLLAAQAAIAEHNKVTGSDWQVRIDLSALEAHDAEMMWKGRTAQAADDRKHYEAQRKPLVDALTPFSKLDSVITLEDVKRAADVLAKVKP